MACRPAAAWPGRLVSPHAAQGCTAVDNQHLFINHNSQENMRKKISQVATDLNVGVQSIRDFLQAKNIEVDSGPNARIAEEAYNMLLEKFKPDMVQKKKSEDFTSKQQERKANSKARSVEEIKIEVKKPRILGKIDLTQAGKPAAKPQPKPEQQPAPAPKPAEPAKKPEAKPAAVVADKPAPEAKPEVKAEDPKPAEPAAPAEEKKVEEKKDEIFTYGTTTLQNKPKILGKIDLSAINQQTRPKKKSKAELRNERISKERARKQGGNAAAGDDGAKRKRRRIGKEKIDIEKSAAQIQNGGGRGGNQGNNAQGGSKRKPKKGKKPFKSEVSEEDVQRQVKETLARLTARTQKKSAKWRREKREAVREEEREEAAEKAAEKKTLKLTEFVTANDLAARPNMKVPMWPRPSTKRRTSPKTCSSARLW